MVATIHVSKLRHRHVTDDTFASFAISRMMCVYLGIFNTLFMTRQTGIVSLRGFLEPVSTAGSVAMYAV